MSSTDLQERVRVLEDLLVEIVVALDDLDKQAFRYDDDDALSVDTGALLAFVVDRRRALLAQLRSLGIEPLAAIYGLAP